KSPTTAVALSGTTVGTTTAVTNGVTVATNNDKTGYTASTVSDKTGYSAQVTSYAASMDPATQVLVTPANKIAADGTGSVKIQASVKLNTALTGWEFVLTDSTTHAPKTGVTGLTCTRSIDGGADAVGGIVNLAEISGGKYKMDFGASDLNG